MRHALVCTYRQEAVSQLVATALPTPVTHILQRRRYCTRSNEFNSANQQAIAVTVTVAVLTPAP
jgi:hypothetical protein